MLISPMTAKLLALSLLSAFWLALFQNAKRLDANQPFHAAAYQRDRRKAQFYGNSVWVGLAAAFLSLLCLDALASVSFDTNALRETVLGILRIVGVWGLLVVGIVWSQVGQRASQPNADGQSLTPIPNEREQPRFDDRRRMR